MWNAATQPDPPATSQPGRALTPREVARQFAVDQHTVLAWISAGLMPALDVRRPGAARPRWRIEEADLAEFRRRRSATPAAAPTPRRRRSKATNVTEYF
jgi:excisionase family DNA binding protein